MKLEYCNEPPRSISRFEDMDAEPLDVGEQIA
jgi:hypothetical protein